jgi:hypothetical protein
MYATQEQPGPIREHDLPTAGWRGDDERDKSPRHTNRAVATRLDYIRANYGGLAQTPAVGGLRFPAGTSWKSAQLNPWAGGAYICFCVCASM